MLVSTRPRSISIANISLSCFSPSVCISTGMIVDLPHDELTASGEMDCQGGQYDGVMVSQIPGRVVAGVGR